MDNSTLETALQSLSARPTPKLPANLEQAIWRKIRSRRTAGESVWNWLVTACLRPGGAISATALTLLIAVGFGAWETTAPRATSLSLNLAVFSADAPTLPSTLLLHLP